MLKRLKKIISVVATALLVLPIMQPMLVSAADTYPTTLSGTYMGITYDLTDGKLTLTGTQEGAFKSSDGTLAGVPWRGNTNILEVEANYIPHSCAEYALSSLPSATTITLGENFINNSGNVVSFAKLFQGDTLLTTVNGLESLNTSSAIYINMFGNCPELSGDLDLSGWDVSNATNFMGLFRSTSITSFTAKNWDLSSCASGKGPAMMFSGCASLTSVDVTGWKTSNIKDMYSMFRDCKALTTVKGLGTWDTSSATAMNHMFYGCEALVSLDDLSGWNTGNVADMQSMFSKCYVLPKIKGIGSWDTSSVTSMEAMFNYCKAVTQLDVSGWDVSSVESMAGMFQRCLSLTSLDLSRWNVSKVKDMQFMFNNCNVLTTTGDISGWNVSQVTTFSNIFNECFALNDIGGDLSGWDVSQATSLNSFFFGCNSLETVSGLDTWNTTACTDFGAMFEGCGFDVIDISHFYIAEGADTHKMLEKNAEIIIFPGATVNDSAVSGLHLNQAMPSVALSTLFLDTEESPNTNTYYELGTQKIRLLDTTLDDLYGVILSTSENNTYDKIYTLKGNVFGPDTNYHKMRVIATVVDTYYIKLPATVSLSRQSHSNTYATDYEVGVKGMIKDTSIVSVVPDSASVFTNGTDSVDATITQTVQKFANEGKADTAIIGLNNYTNITGHIEGVFKKVGIYTSSIGFRFSLLTK